MSKAIHLVLVATEGSKGAVEYVRDTFHPDPDQQQGGGGSFLSGCRSIKQYKPVIIKHKFNFYEVHTHVILLPDSDDAKLIDSRLDEAKNKSLIHKASGFFLIYNSRHPKTFIGMEQITAGLIKHKKSDIFPLLLLEISNPNSYRVVPKSSGSNLAERLGIEYRFLQLESESESESSTIRRRKKKGEEEEEEEEKGEGGKAINSSKKIIDQLGRDMVSRVVSHKTIQKIVRRKFNEVIRDQLGNDDGDDDDDDDEDEDDDDESPPFLSLTIMLFLVCFSLYTLFSKRAGKFAFPE